MTQPARQVPNSRTGTCEGDSQRRVRGPRGFLLAAVRTRNVYPFFVVFFNVLPFKIRNT